MKTVVSSGIEVAFSFDIDVIVPQQPTSSQRARINSGIKQSISRYLSTGNLRKTISLLELRNAIMEENGDLVSLVPSKNRDRERLFLGNVYVSRKYASFAFGAGEEKLLTPSYPLERRSLLYLAKLTLTLE